MHPGRDKGRGTKAIQQWFGDELLPPRFTNVRQWLQSPKLRNWVVSTTAPDCPDWLNAGGIEESVDSVLNLEELVSVNCFSVHIFVIGIESSMLEKSWRPERPRIQLRF